MTAAAENPARRWPWNAWSRTAPAELCIRPELRGCFPEQGWFEWGESLAGELFREAHGRRTLRVLLNGRPYFLKLHYGVGWREILKNWLVGKRPVLGAENEQRACRHLERQGLPAPRVAAFAREGGSPATRRSLILCRELTGFRNLEALAKDWASHPPPAPGAQRQPLVVRESSEQAAAAASGLSGRAARRLVMGLADFVRRLHAAGLIHRDLYLCHLLLRTEPWAEGRIELAVLDLHRAQVHARAPRRWRKRDLAALLFSTLDLPLHPRARLRFLRIYAGQPLRTVFQQEGAFWRSVAHRALKLRTKSSIAHPWPRN